MLPEVLSNHACSLHPGEPKRTLSILMRIDSDGQVLQTEVLESIIESDIRYTYEELHADFKNRKFQGETARTSLEKAYSLFCTIRKKRQHEGKIAFQSTEIYFTLDET